MGKDMRQATSDRNEGRDEKRGKREERREMREERRENKRREVLQISRSPLLASNPHSVHSRNRTPMMYCVYTNSVYTLHSVDSISFLQIVWSSVNRILVTDHEILCRCHLANGASPHLLRACLTPQHPNP